MNDLRPHKHGDEGEGSTHSVCNKHNLGGSSVCCECSGKDDCSSEISPSPHLSSIEKERLNKMDAEIMDWFYECCRINFGVEDMAQDSTELREIIERNLAESNKAVYAGVVDDLATIIENAEAVCILESGTTQRNIMSNILKPLDDLHTALTKDL